MRRMLSAVLALILLMGILLCGCGDAAAGDALSSGETDSAAESGATRTLSGGASDSEEGSPGTVTAGEETSPVREYGAMADLVEQEGAVQIRVNWPEGDVTGLKTAIEDWAREQARSVEETLEEGESAVLSASYSSYEINDRVVSVLLEGAVTTGHDSRPQTVRAAFSADRTTGEVLSLEDLLREGGESALRQLAAERFGVEEGRADLLSDWMLTAEGLELWLDGESAVLTYVELLGTLELPQPERTIDPDRPMVALTFDDGPSENTDRIVDLLQLYNSRATFYVVGSRISSYADQIARCAAQGNEIGIHTWSHSKLTELSAPEIRAEISDTQEAIQQYAGTTAASVRPPGGSYDDTVRAVAGELGLYLVNWSVDTRDWESRDADAVYDAVMSDVTDGAIILCHDLYASTAEAMERIVPDLIDQGYQLVTVSELLSYAGGASPGSVQRHQ